MSRAYPEMKFHGPLIHAPNMDNFNFITLNRKEVFAQALAAELYKKKSIRLFMG